jgi:alpha-tubulin suppressor-like RCC1 family protein
VALPERVQAIAAGMYFSLALGNSGQVYAWGWNGLGQLGLDDDDDRRSPTRIPELAHVHAIAAGQAHAAALGAGSLYGWGSNAAGQLGNAAKEQRRPLPILAISPREQRRDA